MFYFFVDDAIAVGIETNRSWNLRIKIERRYRLIWRCLYCTYPVGTIMESVYAFGTKEYWNQIYKVSKYWSHLNNNMISKVTKHRDFGRRRSLFLNTSLHRDSLGCVQIICCVYASKILITNFVCQVTIAHDIWCRT